MRIGDVQTRVAHGMSTAYASGLPGLRRQQIVILADPIKSNDVEVNYELSPAPSHEDNARTGEELDALARTGPPRSAALLSVNSATWSVSIAPGQAFKASIPERLVESRRYQNKAVTHTR